MSMGYKTVDCLGKVMHNKDDERLGSRDNPNWRELKQQVLREYKFTIAFENASITGYTTEKILSIAGKFNSDLLWQFRY